MKPEDIKRLSREAIPRKRPKVMLDDKVYDRKRDKKIPEPDVEET